MFAGQARRFFPMPDYDLANPQAVKITLHGRVVDAAYSRALIQKTDLPLADVLALDRVQKRLPLEDETVKRLKRAGLIEGRKPNFHVSAAVASAAETKAAYIKTRALDDSYYRKLVTEYLEKFGHASRADINDLLRRKLSDALDEKQKATKIGNLLTSMRKAGTIRNTGPRGVPCWKIFKTGKNEKE
jgi:ATP-dependent DNA helicase RecG